MSVIVFIVRILHGRIKGFNSAIYAIKSQEVQTVVIEPWLGSYRTVVG